jgi:hypothetical protein
VVRQTGKKETNQNEKIQSNRKGAAELQIPSPDSWNSLIHVNVVMQTVSADSNSNECKFRDPFGEAFGGATTIHADLPGLHTSRATSGRWRKLGIDVRVKMGGSFVRGDIGNEDDFRRLIHAQRRLQSLSSRHRLWEWPDEP